MMHGPINISNLIVHVNFCHILNGTTTSRLWGIRYNCYKKITSEVCSCLYSPLNFVVGDEIKQTTSAQQIDQVKEGILNILNPVKEIKTSIETS